MFEHTSLLTQCLAPYPAIRIVLSTSWVREFRGVRKVACRLPPALHQRVVGANFHDRMDPAWFWSVPRGVQVWGDVCRRRPEARLALDGDDAGLLAVCRHRLVHTNPVLCISDLVVLAEIQKRLASMGRPERSWP